MIYHILMSFLLLLLLLFYKLLSCYKFSTLTYICVINLFSKLEIYNKKAKRHQLFFLERLLIKETIEDHISVSIFTKTLLE